jgi:DNA-directed RNA polymerase specialized sigma subunit
MAKPPSIQPASSTGLTPAEANMLIPDNITVSVRNGKRTVEGYNQNGEKVVIQTTIINGSPNQNNGFRSQTMTVCDQLPAEERREAARRLRHDERLSQVEIARRLGVSQKTISNDLKPE